MPSLSEAQYRLRTAIVADDPAAIAAWLVGGRDPSRRLAIHRHHYVTSLGTALVEKFPATVWLAGEGFMREAAHVFVARHPPASPCIAEYGECFPAFLAQRPGAAALPYLRDIAEIDWHLGHATLAVEAAPLRIDALAGLSADALTHVQLRLQPGLRYLSSDWPVDQLMQLFLAEERPERFELAPCDVAIEIRGVRGSFSLTRLSAGASAFRRALVGGEPLGAAAEQAVAEDSSFDVGVALAALFVERLVTGVTHIREGGRP